MQGLVCVLVAAALTNLYLPQPVLPVLAHEFGVAETTASLTISMASWESPLPTFPSAHWATVFPSGRSFSAGAWWWPFAH